MPVRGAGRLPRAGPVGFRCPGGAGHVLAEVPKRPPDSRGCEPVRCRPLLPGMPQVAGDRTSKPELGVGGDDQPRPPVCRLRFPKPRPGPAQRLFEQPKRVLQIEASQERLPGPIDVRVVGASLRGPQPHRRGGPVLRQVFDFQPNQRPVDQGEFALMVQPGSPVGQPGVDPVPRLRDGLAIVRGGGVGGDGGLGPGLRLGEAELRPVIRRPAALRVVDARRIRQPHYHGRRGCGRPARQAGPAGPRPGG